MGEKTHGCRSALGPAVLTFPVPMVQFQQVNSCVSSDLLHCHQTLPSSGYSSAQPGAALLTAHAASSCSAGLGFCLGSFIASRKPGPVYGDFIVSTLSPLF